MPRAVAAGCHPRRLRAECTPVATCLLVVVCACVPTAVYGAPVAEAAEANHGRSELLHSQLRRANLLQAHRRLSADKAQVSRLATRQQPPDWFSVDMEKMDELPNYNITKPKCHPTCKWSCGQSRCNQVCKPRCEPPKCTTTCKKPVMSKCHRTCKEPQCAVVCPPGQCEHGACPSCQTVCNKPVCLLDCGQGRCESRCAEPVCNWDCSADSECAKPECKLTCDAPKVCEFGNLQKRPEEGKELDYNEEITARGLGIVPEEHLKEMAAASMEGAKMLEGAEPMGGASEGTASLSTLTGNTGIEAEGAIEQTPTRWAIGKQFR